MNGILSKSQRLNQLMKYSSCKTRADFARIIGLPYQNVANWFRRDTFDIELLSKVFPEVSAEWLLRGTGAMIPNLIIEDSSSIDKLEFHGDLLQLFGNLPSLLYCDNDDCKGYFVPILFTDLECKDTIYTFALARKDAYNLINTDVFIFRHKNKNISDCLRHSILALSKYLFAGANRNGVWVGPVGIDYIALSETKV